MAAIKARGRRLGSLLLVALLIVPAFTLAVSQPAIAMGKTYECQHPVTTGQEAYDVHHVSRSSACMAVRALARFINEENGGGRLYRCKGLTRHHAGVPVLKMHHFDGWHLHIANRYGFVMSRGHRWFAVGGTDFPLNCT